MNSKCKRIHNTLLPWPEHFVEVNVLMFNDFNYFNMLLCQTSRHQSNVVTKI